MTGMRILFVNRMLSMERGGGETFDLEISKYLSQLGCQISYLSSQPLFGKVINPVVSMISSDEKSCERIAWQSITVRTPYLGWFPWDSVKGGWRLRSLEVNLFQSKALKWALKHCDEFDVIQVCELPEFVTGWKKHIQHIPVVMRMTAPNIYDPGDALHTADGIIASGETITTLKKGIRPDALDISNSVDMSIFKKRPTTFREEHGIPHDAIILLYVARFQKFKNHELLLHSFRLFLKSNPNSMLLLVGSGPLRNYSERLCKELNMLEHVLFLGEVKYSLLPDIYAAADVMVISSTFESFCFAAIEAMATELPVVTTDCGWVPKLISSSLRKNDYTTCPQLLTDGGVVVKQDDPEAFSNALCTMMRDHEMRKKMGQWNRNKIRLNYQWHDNANKLYNFYEKLLRVED